MKRHILVKFSRYAFLAFFPLVLAPFCAAQVYSIRILPTLGGKPGIRFPNYAYGINSSGQVTGCSPKGDSNVLQHIFVWTRVSGMRDLGVRCSGLQLGGINDLGHITSYSSDTGGAFLWSQSGGFQNLGPLAFPCCVNNLDQVVGDFYTSPLEQYLHAFVWSPKNPVLQDLGTLGGNNSFADGINNSGQVVGISETTIWKRCCCCLSVECEYRHGRDP